MTEHEVRKIVLEILQAALGGTTKQQSAPRADGGHESIISFDVEQFIDNVNGFLSDARSRPNVETPPDARPIVAGRFKRKELEVNSNVPLNHRLSVVNSELVRVAIRLESMSKQTTDDAWRPYYAAHDLRLAIQHVAKTILRLESL